MFRRLFWPAWGRRVFRSTCRGMVGRRRTFHGYLRREEGPSSRTADVRFFRIRPLVGKRRTWCAADQCSGGVSAAPVRVDRACMGKELVGRCVRSCSLGRRSLQHGARMASPDQECSGGASPYAPVVCRRRRPFLHLKPRLSLPLPHPRSRSLPTAESPLATQNWALLIRLSSSSSPASSLS